MSAEFVAMDPTGTVLARMKDDPLHQEGTHGTI